MSRCHKLWFSNFYIFATKFCRALIFQTIHSARAYNLSLKYLRFTSSGSIDIGIGNLSLRQRLFGAFYRARTISKMIKLLRYLRKTMFILSFLPISPNPESPTKPWEPLIPPSTDFWVLAKTIREVDIPPPRRNMC